MKKNLFHSNTHAKCILTGEHAVLRGSPAIIFPIKTKTLELTYEPSGVALETEFTSPYGENLMLFFWDVIQAGLKLLNKPQTKLTGKFSLINNIPMGCGMGFSSAICVAVAKWMRWQEWIEDKDLFDFARNLEDNFHGKSSGVDIAGVLSDQSIFFTIQNGIMPLKLNWEPLLYISSSLSHSSTAKCINQVAELWRINKSLAEFLDEEMKNSTLLAISALTAMTAEHGLTSLVEAMQRANHCFNDWGLLNKELQEHMDFLTAQGAIAVKPTGSGAGGYVLSLWQHPPAGISDEMISVF